MSSMNDTPSTTPSNTNADSSSHNNPVHDDDRYSNGITVKVIRNNATFDTSAEDTDGECTTQRRTHQNDVKGNNSDAVDHSDADDDDDDVVSRRPENVFRPASSTRVETLDCTLFSSWEDVATHIFYITTFAMIGTVSRIYMARFFGSDCIRQQGDDSDNNDFLTPVSSQICITSDGKTQRGGAIFIDLPANMIGS